MSTPQISRQALTRRAVAGAMAAIPVAGGVLGACSAEAATRYQALERGGPWLNGKALGGEDLRGKVVLVNFWTYTCINSLRPLPYLRAWADRYRDRGLVVLGVHTPEFSFEHEAPRVRQAVADLGVRYPVVLDNDFRIWRAFGNSAWPGFYLLDGQGVVRHTRLGEGDYDREEQAIQRWLGALRGQPVTDPIREIPGEGPQAAPDWRELESPETYLGSDKAENFAGEGGLRRGRAPRRSPDRLPRNGWSLSGDWDVQPEFAALTGPIGTISYRFHARDLHLVMAPGADDRPVRFRVTLDGQTVGADHGWDVDAQGWGELREARMYQLIRQTGPVRDRTFRIEFQGPGPRGFCFTFG